MDLITASKNGNFDLAFSLLQSGFNTEVRDVDNATPLYWGSCHGHGPICQILIQAGCDVNARVKWGSTPLHAASDRGNLECVEILIDSGAAVNQQNLRGDTALHCAAYRGNMEITRILLNSGADVTVKNIKGETPEGEALLGGHEDVAKCISRHDRSRPIHVDRQATSNRMTSVVPPSYFEATTSNDVTCTQSVGQLDPQKGNNLDSAGYTTYDSCNDSLNIHGSLDYSTRDNVENISPATHTQYTHNGVVDKVYNTTSALKAKSDTRCNVAGIEKNAMEYFPVEHTRNPIHSSAKHRDGFCQVEKVSRDRHVSVSNIGPSYIQGKAADAQQFLNLTSNGRCVATESVDYTGFASGSDVCDGSLQYLEVQSPKRPLRSSTGSLKEHVDTDSEGFVRVLQNQLIDSYKLNDKLAKETESLKLKCSTILTRLTETENEFGKLKGEYIVMKELLQKSESECKVLEEIARKTFSRDSKMDTDAGFQTFAECAIKELTDEELQHIYELLKGVLKSHVLGKPKTELYHQNEVEWIPGVDYVILGDKPIRSTYEDHMNPPMLASVTFLIKHLNSGSNMLLKMYIAHRERNSFASRDGPSLLKLLQNHQNVDQLRHLYHGSVERFKRFLILDRCSSSVLEQVAMATFIVTNYYTVTWASYVDFCRRGSSQCDDSYGYNSVFVLQVIYSLSSALDFLHRRNIYLKTISDDCVVFDDDLRPLFTDIEAAVMKMDGELGKDQMVETESQEGRRKYNVEKEDGIRRFQQTDVCSLGQLFTGLLETSIDCNADRPETDGHVMRFSAGLLQIIHSMASVTQELDTKTVLKRSGFLLYGPKKEKVKDVESCRSFLLSRMLRLLGHQPLQQRKSQRTPVLSFAAIAESVEILRPETEAHFLSNISPHDLWETSQFF